MLLYVPTSTNPGSSRARVIDMIMAEIKLDDIALTNVLDKVVVLTGRLLVQRC